MTYATPLMSQLFDFVASMSYDELVNVTNQYFVIPDPPAVSNPYYVAALHQELTNHQRAKGTC